MLKLRVRNNINSSLFKLQVRTGASLQELKTELKNTVKLCQQEDFDLSLNKKDLLKNDEEEISLHQLGICSGDLIWIIFPENLQVVQNTQQIEQDTKQLPEILPLQDIQRLQIEENCQILNVPRCYNSVKQKLVQNNYDQFQAPYNLINIFHNLMLELFFVTEEISNNFVSQSYFEQRYFLRHSENTQACVDIKFVIFGNQWLIVLGKIEGGWTFNYPLKFDNGIFGKLKNFLENGEIEDERQNEEVRRVLVNDVIYKLALNSCLKMDVAYPLSLTALPNSVKERIFNFIDQANTAGRLSCTCKEFQSLVKSSENLWHKFCVNELKNFKEDDANESFRQHFYSHKKDAGRKKKPIIQPKRFYLF